MKGDTMEIDGVELECRRELEIEVSLPGRLIAEIHYGDVEITGGDSGSARLVLEIHEVSLRDVEVRIDNDGAILLESLSGQPCALGSLRARLPRGTELDLGVGMGNVTVDGLRGARRIDIEAGMGDVALSGLEDVEIIQLEAGMGDIQIDSAINIADVEVTTGLGSIKISKAGIGDLILDTGMGGITIRKSTLGYVSADTGMGNIRFRDTTYNDADTDVGFGRVTKH